MKDITMTVSGSVRDISDEKIIETLREEYFNAFEVPQEQRRTIRLSPETRIYRDLRANDPDIMYALEWRAKTAETLGIDERKLPKPVEGYDYTIQELVDMFKKAAR